MANQNDEYKKLRSYLNNSIRGKNTDAVLKAIAHGPVYLIDNIEAVNDSLYIVSSKNQYLDQRLGDKGISRPDSVGLSDLNFSEIGIQITNRSQTRDLVHQLLRILYGETFTRATSISTELETYPLEDGDNLILSFDRQTSVEISFTTSQFQSISAATAQEVSDAITKSLRKIGVKGSAFVQESGASFSVVLISPTDGPSSSVQVLGGSAQNKLKFDEIRPTSADALTQWTFSQQAGGQIRATWTGSADPAVGVVKVGDYVNIYGTAFDLANRGTFNVTKVQGGTVGNAYIEYENPNGVPETKVQGNVDAILFFNPRIRTLISNKRYAAAFQTSNRTVEIFMPATTKVVRRSRIGSAHLYDGTPTIAGQEGPYIYDPTVGYVISNIDTLTTETLDTSSDSILFVSDASEFPDSAGDLIIGLGTSHQEGPVPYISKLSSTSLRINPSYKFKNNHPVGTDVALIAQNSPVSLSKDGLSYPFYITDDVSGRLYAESLINQITATGIIIIIHILYSNDVGLGKAGDPVNSDKFYVWGTEEDL